MRTGSLCHPGVLKRPSSSVGPVRIFGLNPNSCPGAPLRAASPTTRQGRIIMALFLVGVDVCKARLDVYLQQTRQHRQYPNDAEGCRRLIAAVAKAAGGEDVLVVYEATSIYDGRLRDALRQAGMPSSRANPRRSRQFARAASCFSFSTDPISASMTASTLSVLASRPAARANWRERLGLAREEGMPACRSASRRRPS
jgi:hypothetical protein